MKRSKKTVISFALTLILASGIIAPVHAWIPGGGAPVAGSQYLGGIFESFSILSNTGPTGPIESHGYDYGYYYEYGYDQFSYSVSNIPSGSIIVPLIPSYDMNWNKTNYWGNLTALKQKFVLKNPYVSLKVGENTIVSETNTVDYSSSGAVFTALTAAPISTVSALVRPYEPKMAYNTALVSQTALYTNYSDREVVDKEPFFYNYGAPWPAKIDPGVPFELYIDLKASVGTNVTSPDAFDYRVAIFNTAGAIVATNTNTIDKNSKDIELFLGRNHGLTDGLEPGRYTVRLQFWNIANKAYVSSLEKDLVKFEVEGYTDFITYSINGVAGKIDHRYGTVSVLLPSGSALNNLVPVFTVPDGAVVTTSNGIVDIPQNSGVTPVNFSGGLVVYKITLNNISRYIYVTVDIERMYNFTGTCTLYENEQLTPVANLKLNIYDYLGNPVKAVTTDAFGRFNTSVLYADKHAGSFRVDTNYEIGGKLFKVVEVNNGLLSFNNCYIYPDKDIGIIIAESLGSSNHYQFRGRVVDAVSGNPIEGAKFHWDGVDWGTGSAMDGSFVFDFDNNWKWNSYGFYAYKADYQNASFSIEPESFYSLNSMKQNGYVDLGVIKMSPVVVNQPVEGSVTAVPTYTQRGNAVQVTVKYTNKSLAAPFASLIVSMPSGVNLVPGSISNTSVVHGSSGGFNTITLSGNMVQNVENKLIFMVKADNAYDNYCFNIDARVEQSGVATPYDIGRAYVAISDVTLQTPEEVGIKDANSALFTVSGEVSAITGYSLTLDMVQLDTGNTVSSTAIAIPKNGRWYSKNIYIPGAGAEPGPYAIIVTLKNPSGNTVATASRIVLVTENALSLKGIRLITDHIDTRAQEPVTNSSYVPASIFVNSQDYGIREAIRITTNWESTVNIKTASFAAITQFGVVKRSAAVNPGTPGSITVTFPVNSFRGYGNGSIKLIIEKANGKIETFVIAVLCLLIDPSGVVYDASTGNEVTGKKIAGAVVTLEEYDDVAKTWGVWDGLSNAQSNPQTTTTDGAYAYFVSPGKYRVKVTAAGYQNYSTDTDHTGEYKGFIVVPPPREDVHIGMTPVKVPGGGFIGGGGGGGGAPDPKPTEPAVTEDPVVVPSEPDNPFTDVNESDWFYPNVMYAYQNDLFKGTAATLFSPNLAMTRGMLVTVLGRLHKVDAGLYTGSSFADVSPSQYYAPYIEWAKENGIVLGIGGNNFAPDAIITRQDLAVIFARYMAYANIDIPEELTDLAFDDSDKIAAYAKDAVHIMVNMAIMTGKPGNLFDPVADSTRAEVATVLFRFVEKTKPAVS